MRKLTIYIQYIYRTFQKGRFYTLWYTPIETLMICSYYRKNYLSDNKDNDPGIFVPSMKKFNKNLFIYGAIYYQVESLNSDFESEIKKAINHYRRDQWTKNLPEMFC